MQSSDVGLLKEPEASVILPLFGSHRGFETLRTVVRAWLEQDVPCEVVVATAGEVDVGPPDNVSDNGGLHLVRGPRSWKSAGRLRNLGARSARSRFLYLSDADVLPLRPDYLRRALSLASGPKRMVVAQPWMFRLVSAESRPDIRTWHPPNTKHACYVTTDANGVLTPMPEEQFVGRGEYIAVLAPPSVTGALGIPGKGRIHLPCHWGGVLLDRELFEEVGGYCTAYVGWGCQDDDLLVKLSGRREIVRAWLAVRSLACLHFEHPRPYGGAILEANRARLARRRAMGVEAMIHEDARGSRRRSPGRGEA